jgi:hypothetical protein
MRAAVLATATKELALVAPFGQRAKDSRTPRFGMTAVLLEHKGKPLSNELRTRHRASATDRPGSSAIVVAFFLDSAMTVR